MTKATVVRSGFVKGVWRTTLYSVLLFLPLTASAEGQDTLILRADNPPVWGAAPRLVEELRIGAIDGDQRYTFGYVSGVATTSDGDVWVSDNMLKTIRRYSSEGQHLGDVGREGQGPGEFAYPLDLRLLRDGSMVAWDPLNLRIHKFDRGGEFLEAYRVPVPGAFWGRGLQTIEVDTAGFLYAIGNNRPRRGSFKASPYWIRLTPEGEVSDTIIRPPSDSEGFYHPIATWTAISPLGYLVQGRNHEYAFRHRRPGGGNVRIERPFQAVRYGRSERAEVQEFEEVYAERWGQPPRRMPATKPVWASFEVDAEGRLWIERYVSGVRVEESGAERDQRVTFDTPQRTWGQPLVYDVIDEGGRFLGTLRFPNSATASPSPKVDMVLARGDVVWTVERGEFDEQYVVRYRIEPGA